MSRPQNLESIRSLAEQLLWGMQQYGCSTELFGAAAYVGHNEALDSKANYWYVDGTADNVQIQAALDYLTAGRTWKEKVILNGNFVINSAINVPSYTVIDIRGKITLANGADQNIFMIAPNLSDIEIINGEIDGNKANQTPGANLYLIIKTVGVTSQRIRIANIYLHYALDNWFETELEKNTDYNYELE